MSVSGSTWHCASSKTSATIEVQTSPSRNVYKQVRIIVSVVWRLAICGNKSKWYFYAITMKGPSYLNGIGEIIRLTLWTRRTLYASSTSYILEGLVDVHSVAPKWLLTSILGFGTLYTLLSKYVNSVYVSDQSQRYAWTLAVQELIEVAKCFLSKKLCIIVFPSLATIRALKKSVFLSSMCFEMLAKPKLGALFFSGPIQHSVSKQSS